MPTSTTATRPSPGILLSFPRRGGTVPQQGRHWSLRAVPVLIFMALVLTGIVVTIVQKEESIRDLLPEVRAPIFRRTLAELRSTCVETYAARGPVRDHCVEQARFILRFPECGRECRVAADTVLPRAHR